MLFRSSLIIFMMLMTTIAQARDVKMVSTNWAPYYAQNLTNNGFFTELVVAAFTAVGHKASIEFMPWPRAMKMAKNGRVDLLMGAYYNKQRALNFHFSKPVFTDRIVLVGLKSLNISSYKRLQELSKFNIGIGRGWVYGDDFDKAEFLKKDMATNQIMNIRKLFGKRIDLVASSELVFRYEVAQHTEFNMSDVTVLSPALNQSDLFVLASRTIKDGKQIIHEFNEGLRRIKVNGQFDAILKKHENFELVSP